MGRLSVTSYSRSRKRLADISSAPATLDAAIQALAPLSHWRMRETAGTAFADVGSLNNQSTSVQTGDLSKLTAPDGQPAPSFANAGNSGGSAADQAGYTPSTASGMTVVVAVRPAQAGTGGGWICAKRADAGTIPEWDFFVDPAGGQVFATTRTTANGVARQIATNAAGVTANTWALIIARFSGSLTGYPDLRINGTTPAQTQTGSGTAAGDGAGRLQIARSQSGTLRMVGGMAHLAIFAGQLSNGDCATIESAAHTEGWY